MSNNPSIPKPTGEGRLRIERFMNYVPGSDKIQWNIPMSEVMDPEKNKKLGESDYDSE